MIGATAAFAALLALSSDPGPDARSVPLERVFPFWTDYLALPEDERSAFRLDYVMRVTSGDTASFWVETGNGYVALLPDEFGGVTPPDAAAFEAGRRLFTDAPAGGVGVTMRLSLAGPPAETYALSDLEAAIAQSRNAMRGLMGVRSLFMPALDTIRFRFEGAAPDAVILYEDGREAVIDTVYENVITVRPRDRAYADARHIRFGAPPVEAVLETGR